MPEETRVLVVDDEQDTLNLLKILLEVSGFKPIITLNSVDAIALAELEKPDVALLDVMMPKIDGFALCKMMRLHPQLKDLPIIFITAYEALDLEERKTDAGADEVVKKPIDIDKLVAMISSLKDARKIARKGQTTTLYHPDITPRINPPTNDEMAKPASVAPVVADTLAKTNGTSVMESEAKVVPTPAPTPSPASVAMTPPPLPTPTPSPTPVATTPLPTPQPEPTPATPPIPITLDLPEPSFDFGPLSGVADKVSDVAHTIGDTGASLLDSLTDALGLSDSGSSDSSDSSDSSSSDSSPSAE